MNDLSQYLCLFFIAVNVSLKLLPVHTTVGIDIPDVNILIVEDADRFGLSQLHQLRGRIGRAGSKLDLKCNCLLLSNSIGQQQEGSSLSRLQILQQTTRGEEIADADFMLRGPGETRYKHI